ncbi:MAG: SurA N-terminal domain-containing protein, partial [Pseudomonadota bacterium]|nr:SurA N-terminal domain-containing protein [Pseudomonadota bacterium]
MASLYPAAHTVFFLAVLTTIRDRISGWIAYFVVLLISIPFALWGIETYFGGGNDLVAAEVNGVEIPMQAFTYQYQQQRQYLQQLYGGHLPPGQSDAAIKRTVLQGMVRAELLQQVVSKVGYRISDQALLDAIMKLDAFKTHGQFDPRRYEQILRLQGQTKASFEQDLRRQLAVSYFEDGILHSAFLPPSAEQELQRLKNQRRAFAYFVIPADPARVTIGHGAIARYFA